MQRFSFCINRKNRSDTTMTIVNRVRRIAGILAKFLVVGAYVTHFLSIIIRQHSITHFFHSTVFRAKLTHRSCYIAVELT
jgi:hypothetical protein